MPATAGNISLRLQDGTIAMMKSGGRKGFLALCGVMPANPKGRPLTPGTRPSAETLLRCQIERLFPGVGGVLHGHSVPATVLSMAFMHEDTLIVSGYELQKAFEGATTHESALELPIFNNDQNMARLAGKLEPALKRGVLPGDLIRGHGVYV